MTAGSRPDIPTGTHPGKRRDIDEDVTVHCDELLAEVVGNILTNAVEHNEAEDLRVSISVERDTPVRVRIADNGAGVPDEE